MVHDGLQRLLRESSAEARPVGSYGSTSAGTAQRLRQFVKSVRNNWNPETKQTLKHSPKSKNQIKVIKVISFQLKKMFVIVLVLVKDNKPGATHFNLALNHFHFNQGFISELDCDSVN